MKKVRGAVAAKAGPSDLDERRALGVETRMQSRTHAAVFRTTPTASNTAHVWAFLPIFPTSRVKCYTVVEGEI